MTRVSFIIFYHGRWSASFNYRQYKLHGLTVDASISLVELTHLLVDELHLDVLKSWKLFVNIDSSSNRNDVMELKCDKDVQWFLHMCEDVRDASLPLIVHDTIPCNTILSSEDRTIQDENFVCDDSAPTVDVCQDMNLSNCPENYDIYINQVFGTKEDVQKALTLLAFKRKFQFNIDRSCKTYFNVSCVDKSCGWKACSSKVSNASTFMIRKYVPKHTCLLDTFQAGHRQASSNMIDTCIKDRVVTNNGKIWTAGDVIDYFQKEYNFTIPYQKAWRAINSALDLIRGHSFDSYTLLPLFAQELCLKNPGPVTNYLKDNDGHFKYFYMAVSASIQGWPHCRSMMQLTLHF